MKKRRSAKWESLAEKHESLFGKKPNKNMKIESLERKVNNELDKNDDKKGETLIAIKIKEMVELVKEEATKNEEPPAIICLAATTSGVHMALLGEGKDIAVVIATAMDNQPMINSIVTNASLMFQMKNQDVAKQLEESEGSESPTTKA